MATSTMASPDYEFKDLKQPPTKNGTSANCENMYAPDEIDVKNIQTGSILGHDTFQNPFLSLPSESEINPKSSRFNARAWLENFIGFISQDSTKYPRRTASISLRNLEAHGVNTPTDYQRTVGNVVLGFGSLVRCITQRQKERIPILKGFDGLVNKGEMLLVLGRPGSGCSTLLKTISGNTDGFVIGQASEVNYQGIPASQMHGQFCGEAIYMAEDGMSEPALSFLRNSKAWSFWSAFDPALLTSGSKPSLFMLSNKI